jgi:glycosyltransferase involved in cell wall biosynthesis
MKVSIITAVLDGADSIGLTLDSVAQQDYPDIEHVIADGGSRDGTAEIARSHRSTRTRILSGRDSGVYSAFNKGLHAATGDVIAYLSSGDCYADSGSVSRMMRTLRTADVDAVFADVLIVDAGRDFRVVRRYRSKRFKPSAMAYGFMPAHPTLFLRRRVYDELGDYDTGYRIAGDYEFCVRAFVIRRITYRYVPEPLVRMPRGGLSNRGWRSKMAITKEMLRACRLNGVRTNWLKISLRIPIKLGELVLP